MAKISVIIPTYNHGRFVSDAIQSVLGQSYPNTEIIVVDDGSVDDTQSVVAQFGEQVQYIWQENQGLSAARNTGIAASTGEFIGLLDADDIYEPDFLKVLVTTLQQNPDCQGIYCGYQFVDEENRPLHQIEQRVIQPEQLYEALLDGNFLVPECLLLHRACYLNSHPFDEALTACEDWDMWLTISKRYKLMGLEMVLIRHRILSGSMSSDPLRMLQNRLTVLQKHVGAVPIAQMSDEQRRAYGYIYLTTAIEYLQYKDRKQTYNCLYKMCQYEPSLLGLVSTLYEIGFGSQPKGYRGDFKQLDLEANSAILLELLQQLHDDPELSATLQPNQQDVFATAYFVLGLLHYGKRQFKEAFSFFCKAIYTKPQYIVNQQLINSLSKSAIYASTRPFMGAESGAK